MKGLVLGLVLATTAANECCGNQALHRIYEEGQVNITVCLERGGIPITTQISDGSHHFKELTGCAFPCDQRVPVGKGKLELEK